MPAHAGQSIIFLSILNVKHFYQKISHFFRIFVTNPCFPGLAIASFPVFHYNMVEFEKCEEFT